MNGKDAYIRIEQLSKHFGPVIAVDKVDFSIAGGEFFSLLGASGCGKTTLLRMLAGFESPNSGEIYIDGVAMSGVPPHKRPTNMVFQNYAIFPHLNVRRNIAYGLRSERVTGQEANKRVDEALELVENGIVSAEQMLTMALKYMSTDDVADMLDCNELSARFMDEDGDEEDWEDDGQPSWEQEWADFGECYE